MDNERLQEIFLIIGDKLAVVSKKWWYGAGIALVLLIPFYYVMKFSFVAAIMSRYHAPQLVYEPEVKQPLNIIDKQIFTLPNNKYSGYVKIENINLQWGVASQDYMVEFKTYGGTTLNKISASTFILPSSTKLIVFSSFTSPQKPDEMIVSLGETRFILKPDIAVNLELERLDKQNNPDSFVVSAGIKNSMAFTVKQINLPVALYNNKNEIVGVNFYSVNDVLSGETRSFQYVWPMRINDAVRAEINPEVDIFDRNIFTNEQGVSPFENQ